MKAFGLADEDSPAALLDVPTPEAGPGEVRVLVRASSVNGWDVFVMAGMARGSMEHRYPVVGGKDFAGVIDSVGEGVTGLAVGDEILGIVPNAPFLSLGSYAEYLVVPAEGFIQPKPENLNFEQAASLGLAALTALVSVDAIEPSDGDIVLIVGAAGGVGSYAVQLAAARGATVVATARPRTKSGSEPSARPRSSTTRATSRRRFAARTPTASTASSSRYTSAMRSPRPPSS